MDAEVEEILQIVAGLAREEKLDPTEEELVKSLQVMYITHGYRGFKDEDIGKKDALERAKNQIKTDHHVMEEKQHKFLDTAKFGDYELMFKMLETDAAKHGGVSHLARGR